LNNKIIWKIFFLNLLFCVLVISGCSNKPYLTGDNDYCINTVKTTGEIQKQPLKIPWNFNMAVMRNLLDESSFVLSDLHTPDPDDPPKPSNDLPEPSGETIFLESIFPESQTMTLTIDHDPVVLDINSIQIEVKGANIGKIILNQTLIFQGIDNPDLEQAFNDFVKELKKTKENSSEDNSSKDNSSEDNSSKDNSSKDNSSAAKT